MNKDIDSSFVPCLEGRCLFLSPIVVCFPHGESLIIFHQSRFDWNKFPVNYTTTFWGKHPFLCHRFVSHPNPRSVYNMVRFLAIYTFFNTHGIKKWHASKMNNTKSVSFSPLIVVGRVHLETLSLKGMSYSFDTEHQPKRDKDKTRSCLSFRFIIRFLDLPQTRSICDPWKSLV